MSSLFPNLTAEYLEQTFNLTESESNALLQSPISTNTSHIRQFGRIKRDASKQSSAGSLLPNSNKPIWALDNYAAMTNITDQNALIKPTATDFEMWKMFSKNLTASSNQTARRLAIQTLGCQGGMQRLIQGRGRDQAAKTAAKKVVRIFVAFIL